MGESGIMARMLALFLIIFFFSGVCILLLIAWSSVKFKDIQYPSGTGQIQKPQGPPGNGKPGSSGEPIFLLGGVSASSEEVLPGLELLSDEKLYGPDTSREIEKLKMRIISNLRRHVINGAKFKGNSDSDAKTPKHHSSTQYHINQYGVDFTKIKSKSKANREEIMCKLKKLEINFVNENLSPIFKDGVYPEKSIFTKKPENTGEPLYKSCAIVSNSAALDGSKHGLDIDSHEFVIRFNNAPTEGWVDDVGTLTSLRIVNSQVVTKPRFAFPYASMAKYNAVSAEISLQVSAASSPEEINPDDLLKLEKMWNETEKFLIWDPCNYSATLEQWYSKPDFPLFDKYFELTRMATTEKEKNRYYILDPRVIWRFWEILQEYTFVRISGTPPTSGFLGILFALKNCERVDVYEYIPSVRESERCHYYGPKNENNPTCTYGSWHPVSAEKLFFLELTDSSDKEIFIDGAMSIPGTSQYKC